MIKFAKQNHLVVKKSILSDALLLFTVVAFEEYIVGLCPSVLHWELAVAFVTSGSRLDQSMILCKFYCLISMPDSVMKRNKVKSLHLQTFAYN